VVEVKAKVIVQRKIVLKDGRFVAMVTVFEVKKDKKFPDGIKAKFLLQDAHGGFARLLIDNHEPYGFHMHTKLPENSDFRIELDVTDYNEALEYFLNEVERIIKNEEE
jgi:hypothetical protein